VARIPAVLRHRDFNLYWLGVVLSQVGTRGAVAANLYQIYELTGSTLQVGLVGAGQAIALLVLSPLGGVYADRLDRRRLLQVTQSVSMLVALGLAVLTVTGAARPWHVFFAVVLTTAAATFDQPARQALIPAMVPREQLPEAFALLNPSRELAILIGPALAGLLIAVSGPEAMYFVDAGTYAALIVILGLVRIPRLAPPEHRSVLQSLRDGARYVRRRSLIWQLMLLDLSATVFGAYRVLLPAFALDVLHVGPQGYGVLSSAPSLGALLSAGIVFRLVRSRRSGVILLAATVGYGLSCVLFAQARVLWLALAAALLLGLADALATTVRHAAVQLETPDELRGRVQGFYQMSSRGGPAIGDVNVGWLASLFGPVVALTAGGLVSVALGGAFLLRGGAVRDYEAARPAREAREQPSRADPGAEPAAEPGEDPTGRPRTPQSS
jgi:MFS family permease